MQEETVTILFIEWERITGKDYVRLRALYDLLKGTLKKDFQSHAASTNRILMFMTMFYYYLFHGL